MADGLLRFTHSTENTFYREHFYGRWVATFHTFYREHVPSRTLSIENTFCGRWVATFQ